MKNDRINSWSEYDKQSHLKPGIKKEQFDSLNGFDLGWLLLEPIGKSLGESNQEENQIKLSKRFSLIRKHYISFGS